MDRWTTLSAISVANPRGVRPLVGFKEQTGDQSAFDHRAD